MGCDWESLPLSIGLLLMRSRMHSSTASTCQRTPAPSQLRISRLRKASCPSHRPFVASPQHGNLTGPLHQRNVSPDPGYSVVSTGWESQSRIRLVLAIQI
jgi:hypothetical protein